MVVGTTLKDKPRIGFMLRQHHQHRHEANGSGIDGRLHATGAAGTHHDGSSTGG